MEDVRRVFTGELVTQFHKEDGSDKKYADDNDITAVPGIDEPGMGRDGVLRFNDNSGAQALQLAVFRGAKRVILLGFDMQNTDGKSHWFGDHPLDLATSPNYSIYVHKFTKLAADLDRAGVEVINCSRATALTQFKRAELCETLTR